MGNARFCNLILTMIKMIHIVPSSSESLPLLTVTTETNATHRAVPLPNEILNLIFKEHDQPGLRHWHAISLVCRQWRNTVLPYLFKKIIIHVHPMDAYLRFFAITPWVAAHVRTLTVKNLNVDIFSMGSLVGHLPYLKTLDLQDIRLHRDSDWRSLQLQTPLTLDTLNIVDLEVSPSEQNHLVLDLLALFTNIGKLTIHENGTFQICRMQVEDAEQCIAKGVSRLLQGPRKRPRCYKLFLGHGIYASFLFPRLSSLSLIFTSRSSITMTLLNELLYSVGSTLTTLCIRVVQGLQWCNTNNSPKRHAVSVVEMQRGLMACSVLENLKLLCGIPYKIHDKPQFDSLPSHAWRFSLELLSHIPADRLHLLTIDLSTGYTFYDDPHRLPWAEMQNVIRRFNNIQSLVFRLNTFDNAEKPCVAYELRGFMDAFEHSSALPPRFDCGHAGCMEYQDMRKVPASRA